MALTYGFYNSVNGDRKYNASQMSTLFKGIINDGVFSSIGGNLIVTGNGNLTLNVSTGRAWFNDTWTDVDSILVVTAEAAEVALNRIDTVALKVDKSTAVRANSIVIIKGEPATDPVPPTLVDTDEVFYHPLANVYRGANTSDIETADITNLVGTTACPFITGVMATATTDQLVQQWESQFSIWFQHLRDELDENQAAHLQAQIDDITDSWTITIPNSAWVTDGTYADLYSQTVTVGGITSNDNPEWALALSGILGPTREDLIEAGALIIGGETLTDSIKMYATDIPGIDIPIVIKRY